jgi:hypothetical protein
MEKPVFHGWVFRSLGIEYIAEKLGSKTRNEYSNSGEKKIGNAQLYPENIIPSGSSETSCPGNGFKRI